MKIEVCYFCNKKRYCIKEDVGGEISVNNKTDVCLNCSISDKIRRFEEKEINLEELKEEIIDIINR